MAISNKEGDKTILSKLLEAINSWNFSGEELRGELPLSIWLNLKNSKLEVVHGTTLPSDNSILIHIDYVYPSSCSDDELHDATLNAVKEFYQSALLNSESSGILNAYPLWTDSGCLFVDLNNSEQIYRDFAKLSTNFFNGRICLYSLWSLKIFARTLSSLVKEANPNGISKNVMYSVGGILEFVNQFALSRYPYYDTNYAIQLTLLIFEELYKFIDESEWHNFAYTCLVNSEDLVKNDLWGDTSEDTITLKLVNSLMYEQAYEKIEETRDFVIKSKLIDVLIGLNKNKQAPFLYLLKNWSLAPQQIKEKEETKDTIVFVRDNPIKSALKFSKLFLGTSLYNPIFKLSERYFYYKTMTSGYIHPYLHKHVGYHGKHLPLKVDYEIIKTVNSKWLR